MPKVVDSYPAFGGPLHGCVVTEQYAGDEYHRFNSADKVTTMVWDNTLRCRVRETKPKCVLVHDSGWPGRDPKSVKTKGR